MAAFTGKTQAEATQRHTQLEDMEAETTALSPKGAASSGVKVENVEAMEAESEAQTYDEALDSTTEQGDSKSDEHSTHRESTFNKEFPRNNADADAELEQGKNDFRIQLDVSNFSPDEISVEVTTNGHLKVRAEHVKNTGSDDRKKSNITKEFFIDEAQYDLDSIRSSLSKTGVLTVEAKAKVVLSGLRVPVQVQVE